MALSGSSDNHIPGSAKGASCAGIDKNGLSHFHDFKYIKEQDVRIPKKVPDESILRSRMSGFQIRSLMKSTDFLSKVMSTLGLELGNLGPNTLREAALKLNLAKILIDVAS